RQTVIFLYWMGTTPNACGIGNGTSPPERKWVSCPLTATNVGFANPLMASSCFKASIKPAQVMDPVWNRTNALTALDTRDLNGSPPVSEPASWVILLRAVTPKLLPDSTPARLTPSRRVR